MILLLQFTQYLSASWRCQTVEDFMSKSFIVQDSNTNGMDRFSLKDLFVVTDFSDDESDQLSELKVGETMSLDGGNITITREL